MSTITARAILSALTVLTLGGQMAQPAYCDVYQGQVSHTHSQSKVKTFFQAHPKVKSATVGAAVGTAAGAVAGLLSGRGIGRGALMGAGTGAGLGLIRSSGTLKRHPILRDTATGATAGLGLGLMTSRGGKSGLKGAAVGGAIGLGLSVLRKELK